MSNHWLYRQISTWFNYAKPKNIFNPFTPGAEIEKCHQNPWVLADFIQMQFLSETLTFLSTKINPTLNF